MKFKICVSLLLVLLISLKSFCQGETIELIQASDEYSNFTHNFSGLGELDWDSLTITAINDSVNAVSIPTIDKIDSISLVPKGTFLTFVHSSGVLTSLVFDASNATYDSNKHMTNGYVKYCASTGMFFGKFLIDENGDGLFGYGTDWVEPELYKAEEGRPPCFFKCFLYKYNEIKTECESNKLCDFICDFLPCQKAWAFEAFTDCMNICYPGGIQA